MNYWWSARATEKLAKDIIREHPDKDLPALEAILYQRQEERDREVRQYIASHPELVEEVSS